MALERVMGIHSAPLPAVATQGGNSAVVVSASGEPSRDKTQARVERLAVTRAFLVGKKPSATTWMRPCSQPWCTWNQAATPRPSPPRERRA